MRETRADTTRALVLAVFLHLLLGVLVFLGLGWVRESAEPAGGGPVVEAEMVDAGSLSARMRQALARREPAEQEQLEAEPSMPTEPLPEDIGEPLEAAAEPDVPVEPEPQAPAAPPEPPPAARPDTREQEAVRREAIARETREREQEALRRQAEQQKRERQAAEAAEEKRRLAAQQQAQADARAKAAADAKAADAKAREEREAREARARQLAAARAQQQADAEARAAARSNPGPASGAGQGRDTRAEWLALVVGEIEKQWRRPDDIPRGQRCPIRIKLLPGGDVLSAEVQPSCPYSEENRRTVEAAVKKASPLPLKGNENLELRDFVVNFYPSR